MPKKNTDYIKKTQRERSEEPDIIKPKKSSLIQKALSKQINPQIKTASKKKNRKKQEGSDDEEGNFISLKNKKFPKKKITKKNNNNNNNDSEDQISEDEMEEQQSSGSSAEDFEDFSLSSDDNEEKEDSKKKLSEKELNSPSRAVYISRLPFGLFEKELGSFFAQFGPVSYVIHPRTTAQKSRYHAFVIFKFSETAEIAQKALNGYVFKHHVLKSRNLTVKEWQEFTKKSKKKKRRMQRQGSRQIKNLRKLTLQRKKYREGKRKKQFEALGIPTSFLK